MIIPRLLALLLLAVLPSRLPGDPLLPPMNGRPDDFAPRRAGAEADARIKLTVTNGGLHRVTQPELTAAGVNPDDLVGARLRLFCRTQEVALAVSQDGLWTADDGLVFFAEPHDGPYSKANAYWLGFGDGGKRMENRPAQPLPDAPERTTCAWTIRWHQDAFLLEKYLPEDESLDHWFALYMPTGRTNLLTLSAPAAVRTEPGRLTFRLHGLSSSSARNPDHRTEVSLNGERLTCFSYDGKGAFTGTADVPGRLLKPVNTLALLQLAIPGLAINKSLLSEITLAYTRRLAAEDGRLLFPAPAGAANYRVTGFPAADPVWLLDVTDPGRPVRLTGWETLPAGATASLRFGAARGREGRYAAFSESRFRRVPKIAIFDFPDWASPACRADYLILAPAAFAAEAERLAQARRLGGLTAEVARLPHVYNLFSYGLEDAGAIKAFLGYAYHHWAGRPRYVLLAGSGSFDPTGNLMAQRGRQSCLKKERIPVHMGPTVHGWASLDGWYAQVDGADRLPDLALGRLPAETPAMLRGMVDKILAYEALPDRSPRRREALLVADRSDASLDGRAECEQLRESILGPAGFRCTTGYTDEFSEDLVRQVILSSLQAGVSLVCYFGHGHVSQWGNDLLVPSDLAALDNPVPPIVLMMSCRNGAFQNPLENRSMTEAFLQRPTGGGCATLATTAISFGPSVVAFAGGFCRSLVTERTRRLGDAFLDGLADLNAYNPVTQELLYLNLFGDPAMTVNPPAD